MVYGFVRQSGGHVKIDSRLGVGTTVKLFLPRARLPAAESDEAGMPTEPIQHRGEHILVVEDDVLVRAYVATQLTKLGYKVTTAANGKDAIALLSGDGSYDLLFTDIVMPGSLTGRDVAEKATELHPNIRVLFTSGYTQNAVMHHGRLDPGVQLLSKPYRLHQLAAKIREALD
jgi:CheY-like chemotaxis protein